MKNRSTMPNACVRIVSSRRTTVFSFCSALIKTENYDPESLIDGFSPIQRFFLSWAQCWRQNVTKERALQLLTIDPHGPNEMRCNGPLSNMPEFLEAFSVTANDPMYKEPAVRVDIW
jgi:putative endopeptidase